MGARFSTAAIPIGFDVYIILKLTNALFSRETLHTLDTLVQRFDRIRLIGKYLLLVSLLGRPDEAVRHTAVRPTYQYGE